MTRGVPGHRTGSNRVSTGLFLAFRGGVSFKPTFSQVQHMVRWPGPSPRQPVAQDPAITDPAASASVDPATTVSADDAPRTCANCSGPLTVGERMFYFLEGAEARPICRACLARLEPPAGESADDWLDFESLGIPAPAGETSSGEPSLESRGLTRAVRSLLIEEIDRIDLAIDRLAEKDPDLPFVRSLYEELRGAMSANQLAEALVSLRDLRRILTAKNLAPSRGSLTAPWDESVEELFDRVMARARAMSRKGGSSGEPVEVLESLEIPGPLRTRSASS